LVDPGVFRQVDGAEPAAANRLENLVLADNLTAEEHPRRSIAPAIRARWPTRAEVLRSRGARTVHLHSTPCSKSVSLTRSASRPYNPAIHRLFAPALDPGDETVALPRDEAEHLLRVLRLGVGDAVTVFDGRGHEFLAKVASATRRDVTVQLVSRL